MNILITHNSNKPIYEMVYEQIAVQIISRQLQSGYCLPSIRVVASELSISVITVKKAWELLEQNGFIFTISGKGCYVENLTDEVLSQKRFDIATAEIKDSVALLKSLKMTSVEVAELIKGIFDD